MGYSGVGKTIILAGKFSVKLRAATCVPGYPAIVLGSVVALL